MVLLQALFFESGLFIFFGLFALSVFGPTAAASAASGGRLTANSCPLELKPKSEYSAEQGVTEPKRLNSLLFTASRTPSGVIHGSNPVHWIDLVAARQRSSHILYIVFLRLDFNVFFSDFEKSGESQV